MFRHMPRLLVGVGIFLMIGFVVERTAFAQQETPTETPTETPVESPTVTPVPPTNTPVPPPTNTPVPPTSTPVETGVETPTETPTPVPPTNTPVPPTATPTPETAGETPTPVPATPTPTNTPVPPTPTTPPAALPGDATGDGVVDDSDVIGLLDVALGIDTPTPEQLAALDLNGDGRITPQDAQDLYLRLHPRQ